MNSLTRIITLKILFSLVVFTTAILLFGVQYAQGAGIPSCGFTYTPNPLDTSVNAGTFTFTKDGIISGMGSRADGGKLWWEFTSHSTACGLIPWTTSMTVSNRNNLTDLKQTITKGWGKTCANDMMSASPPTQQIHLIYKYPFAGTTKEEAICEGTYSVAEPASVCTVKWSLPAGSKGDVAGPHHFTVSGITLDPNKYNSIVARLDSDAANVYSKLFATNGVDIDFDLPNISPAGKHTLTIYPAMTTVGGGGANISVADNGCSSIDFTVSDPGVDNICNDPTAEANKDCSQKFKDAKCSWCTEANTHPGPQIPDIVELCDQLPDPYKGSCNNCRNGVAPFTSKGLWTAIGCVPTDFTGIVNKYILTYGIGIAGGVAFLRFLYGAFLILTSGGNAETLEEARQIITSSIIGLLIVIFSVFFLQTIGVDILQLPNWASQNKTACVGRAQSACTSPCVWGLIPGSSITGCY